MKRRVIEITNLNQLLRIRGLLYVLCNFFVFYANPLHATPIKSVKLEQVLSIGKEKDEIFQWADVDTDSEQNIYLTDALDFSIKKFDKFGRLLAKSGKKGQGPGEFSDPRMIALFHNRVFVTEQSKPGIQVFDDDLRYLYFIPFYLPIVDLRVINMKKILLAHISANFCASLSIIDTTGAIEQNHLILPDVPSGQDMQFFRFALDAEHNLLISFVFQNIVLKTELNGKEIWRMDILKDIKQETKKVGNFILPVKMFYKDIKTDNQDNVFVLSGQITDEKKQQIFVFDKTGNPLTSFFLPHPTHLIHIDKDNYLYARAEMGTCLVKYKMYYEK